MKTRNFNQKTVANFSATMATQKSNVKTTMVMKSMLAAILLCCASINVQAQDEDYYNTKDEVAITIGAGTTSQFLDAFSELFSVMGEVLVTSTLTGGHYTGYTTYENEKDIPALSVEYFHHLSKVVSVGGIFGFSGTSSDMYCNWQPNDGYGSTKEKVGSAHKYYYTLMPAAKFDWLRKKNYGLYSKVGAGATFVTEKETQDVNGGDKEVYSDNDVFFNLQATFIGVEVGSEKFRGFAELGVGEQGIILAGVRYKF